MNRFGQKHRHTNKSASNRWHLGLSQAFGWECGPLRGNVIAISPSKVIRTRTVQKRPEAERWSPHIIETLQSTPQTWDTAGEVTPEGLAIDADDFDTGEPFETEDPEPSSSSAAVPRRPRLSHAKRRRRLLSNSKRRTATLPAFP